MYPKTFEEMTSNEVITSKLSKMRQSLNISYAVAFSHEYRELRWEVE